MSSTLESFLPQYASSQVGADEEHSKRERGTIYSHIEFVLQRTKCKNNFSIHKIFLLWKSVVCKPEFTLISARRSFKQLEIYVLTLAKQPWNKHFYKLKQYSGYLNTHVAPYVKDYVVVFQLLGYQQTPDQCLKLSSPPDIDVCIRIAFNLFLCQIVCLLINKMYRKVSANYTEHEVAQIYIHYDLNIMELSKHLSDNYSRLTKNDTNVSDTKIEVNESLDDAQSIDKIDSSVSSISLDQISDYISVNDSLLSRPTGYLLKDPLYLELSSAAAADQNNQISKPFNTSINNDNENNVLQDEIPNLLETPSNSRQGSTDMGYNTINVFKESIAFPPSLSRLLGDLSSNTPTPSTNAFESKEPISEQHV